jgi:cytoskeletal protein CcmA (bactofilin family)
MFRSREKFAARVDTLIGKSTRVKGDLQFQGGLHVEGTVVGNISAEPESKAMLSISEAGRIEGNIDVTQVVLNGTVYGDVIASESVVLGATARVHGNVQYGAIEMSFGAEVSGRMLPRNANGATTATVSNGNPGVRSVSATPSPDFSQVEGASAQ